MRSVTASQIALIGLLMTAIIVAHVFAPGAFATVSAIVGVVFSWLMPSPLTAGHAGRG